MCFTGMGRCYCPSCDPWHDLALQWPRPEAVAIRLGATGTCGTLVPTVGGGPAVRSTPAGKPIRDESAL